MYLIIPAVVADGLLVELPTGSFTPPVPETERILDEDPGAIVISSFCVEEIAVPSIESLGVGVPGFSWVTPNHGERG